MENNILNYANGNTVKFDVCLGDRGLVEARHVSLPKIDGMIIGEVVDKNTPDIDPQSSKISPSTTNHEIIKPKTVGGVKNMICTVSTECNMDDAATPEVSDKERFISRRNPPKWTFQKIKNLDVYRKSTLLNLYHGLIFCTKKQENYIFYSILALHIVYYLANISVLQIEVLR